MYKQEDILKKSAIPEDECDVCMLHKRATDFFQEKCTDDITGEIRQLCPICNSQLIIETCLLDDEIVVVGGHNGYTTDESIGYYPIRYCESCEKFFALMPIEVQYNGNHGIVYTGGNYFLSTSDEEFILERTIDAITKSVEQYHERILSGEKGLKPFYLEGWIRGELAHALAEFLYSKGLKK